MPYVSCHFDVLQGIDDLLKQIRMFSSVALINSNYQMVLVYLCIFVLEIPSNFSESNENVLANLFVQ